MGTLIQKKVIMEIIHIGKLNALHLWPNLKSWNNLKVLNFAQWKAQMCIVFEMGNVQKIDFSQQLSPHKKQLKSSSQKQTFAEKESSDVPFRLTSSSLV